MDTAATERVRGELYELIEPERTLAELDRFETDASAQFQRREVVVSRDSGEEQRAWVYFYIADVREEWRIPSGDYLDGVNAREVSSE